MRHLLVAAIGVGFACTGAAQVTEVPTMTVPHSFIDMDVVGPAGPTTLGALIAAGTNGGAPLLGVNLTPSAAVAGIYNTNPSLGRALGYDGASNGLILVDPPSGAFTAFDAQFDLALPSTEFGIAIGDWASTMVLDFSLLGVPIGSVTSTAYSSANAKFFRSSTPFDRVNVRASSSGGNWVIPELYIQNGVGWGPFGSGCGGSNGVPLLAAGNVPARGQPFTLNANNLPAGGGLWALAFGFSTSSIPGLGSLPFDLAPFGAPGCSVLCSIATLTTAAHANGSGSQTFAIPNNVHLLGVTFANQAWVLDPAANALGLTASNGGRGQVQ